MVTGIEARSDFSRVVEVSKLSPEGAHHVVAATAEECQQLARRLGLVALNRLTAELMVAPRGARGSIRLSGRFEAEVVQSCVVTLEPLTRTVRQSIERTFTAEPASLPAQIVFDPDSEELPDPLLDNRIDMGEVIAEELALAIDPYPRKPGAELSWRDPSSEERPAESPFAVLKRLPRS
jgi:uncharacterized metal-binding protein YceD (DUF177 family)